MTFLVYNTEKEVHVFNANSYAVLVAAGRYSSQGAVLKLVIPTAIAAIVLVAMLLLLLYFYWSKIRQSRCCSCRCCQDSARNHTKMDSQCNCDTVGTSQQGLFGESESDNTRTKCACEIYAEKEEKLTAEHLETSGSGASHGKEQIADTRMKDMCNKCEEKQVSTNGIQCELHI